MTIRQKIKLVMFLAVALGMLLALIFFQAQTEIDAVITQERQANTIALASFQLTLLDQDISFHPDNIRASNQWQKQHGELGEILDSVSFDEPQDKAILERIRHAQENQLTLFAGLQQLTHEQRRTGETEINVEQRERLVHRLSFSAQSMLSDALSLQQRKRMEVTQYRRKAFRIVLILAGSMTSAIALLAYLIGRSIIRPLQRLRRQTEIIGAGDLTHRVGTTASDELGELSRDFDRMLERLQHVTASREELQHEVEARIRTEDALRKSEQSLKKAQAIAHLGSWEWDVPTGTLTWTDEIYRIFGQRPGLFTPTYETFMGAVHPGDRALVAQSMEQALQGRSYDIEHRILLPDGDIRVVQQVGEAELDDSGEAYGQSAKPIRVLGTVHDVTERKHAEDELHEANARLGAQLAEIEKLQVTLREQAIRDPLTGLFNRRYLDETLEREFAGADRENYAVSLIMMDIDHFKKINDTYGHPAGDMALRALAEMLSGHIRGRDIACRIGGEEFLAVLPHTAIETAARRAELWRASFEALRMTYDGQEIRATISLGVAAYAIHGKTGTEVIAAADKGLYLAKQSGRNRVVVAQLQA